MAQFINCVSVAKASRAAPRIIDPEEYALRPGGPTFTDEGRETLIAYLYSDIRKREIRQ